MLLLFWLRLVICSPPHRQCLHVPGRKSSYYLVRSGFSLRNICGQPGGLQLCSQSSLILLAPVHHSLLDLQLAPQLHQLCLQPLPQPSLARLAPLNLSLLNSHHLTKFLEQEVLSFIKKPRKLKPPQQILNLNGRSYLNHLSLSAIR